MGTTAAKEQFYHQLSTMLNAGLSVRAATEHLVAQRNQQLPSLASTLADGAARGLTLSEALRQTGSTQAEPLEIALLEAGERGGRLELATQQLSDHFALLAQLWWQIRKALIYPLIVLHGAIILPSIMAFQGGPTAIWKQIGQPLLIAYFIIGLVWFVGKFLWAQGHRNRSIDRFLNMIPGIGGWRRKLSLAAFCQALGMQLHTGENVAKAVRSAGKASATANLNASGKAMAQEIRQYGCPLGPLLLQDPAIPSDLAQILATAEVAGRLDEEALLRAQRLLETARQSAADSSNILPKLIYAPIAIFAIYRIFAFYRDYVGSIGQGLDLE